MRVPGLSPTSPLLTNAPTRPIPTLRALFENRFVKEGSLLLLGYIVYMSLRHVFLEDVEAVGRTNALKVIDIEKSLGIYWEPALQSRLLSEASWVVTFFNWAYSLGFLPIIVPGALALLCLRYEFIRLFPKGVPHKLRCYMGPVVDPSRHPTQTDDRRGLHRFHRGHGAGVL